mgnify:CR=1 FL=1
MIYLDLNKKVKIGYSDDYANNALSNVENGTHEIIAIFDLNRESLNAKIQIPRF